MKQKWLRERCIRQCAVCILLYGIAGSAVTVNGGNLSLQRGPVKAEMRTDRLLDREVRRDQPNPVPQMEDSMEEQHRDICGEIRASRENTKQEPLPTDQTALLAEYTSC